MSKRISAKYKIDRRMGENIWGRPKNHGHVLVNGKKVNIPSYRCREGDVIEVREKSRTMALVLEALESPERDLPDYISVDPKAMKSTFVRVPSFDEVPYAAQMEPNLVVEFYSR